MGAINEIPLSELIKDDSFFNDLKAGNCILVLGSGFSYGVPSKAGMPIPTGDQFAKLTEAKFKLPYALTYSTAAEQWEGRIKSDPTLLNEFKDMFRVDEGKFNFKLYSAIFLPNWYNIFTLNFDNVLECTQQKTQDTQLKTYSYPLDSLDDSEANIIHLHGLIDEKATLDTIVFTPESYLKLDAKLHDLYDVLYGDVSTHKRKIIIIGSQFKEQIVLKKFFKGLPEDKSVHIFQFDTKTELEYTDEFVKRDYKWINCSAEKFLKLISDNADRVRKDMKIPEGLIRIAKKLKSEETFALGVFSDFLESRHLKYLSRGSFKLTLPDNADKAGFYGETDLMNFLKTSDCRGLIIHGKGGIGKTRLMLELGKRIAQKKGNIVFEVKKEFDNFEALIEFLNARTTVNYTLLFDYVEGQKIFYKTVSWITRNRISNVKIIANCRESYLPTIKYSVGDYYKTIDIGFQNTLEESYKKAIILSIISSITDETLSRQLQNRPVLKTFYEARPSFAAFIKYIHFKNPGKDLNIHANESFTNWLIRKLKLTIVNDEVYPDFFEKKKYIFQLLSCFPANAETVSKLELLSQGEISFADEISKLIHDGWIDEVDGTLTVVHDSVNDTLLVEFLKHFHFREFYIIDFLNFALANGSLSAMMWSIQRIWDIIPEEKAIKLQKSIAKFLDTAINENTVKQEWFIEKIGNTHLLEEEDRIKLFMKYRDSLKDTFATEKFGSSLSFSMNWVAKTALDETVKTEYAAGLNKIFFEDWNIDDKYKEFVEDASLGGKIISSYINLYGIDDFISGKFNEYVKTVRCIGRNLEFISYVVVSWLDNDGPVTDVLQELVASWTKVYIETTPQTVYSKYLLEAWLKKGKDVSIVSQLVGPNLKSAETNISTKTTIVRFWLQKSDDVKLVEFYITECLSQELYYKTACNIIKFWLMKSDNPLLVKPFIEKWLVNEVESRIFYLIFQNWLAKGDDPDILIRPIKKWIVVETNLTFVLNIIERFIGKGGDVDALQPEIIQWLSLNESNVQSVSVLSAFLSNIRDVSILSKLETTVSRIIQNFNTLKQTGFCISFWLVKSENPLLTKPFISSWLTANGDAVNVAILMTNWIRFGDDPYLIEGFIQAFFTKKENRELYESRYLITYWLAETNSPLTVREGIKPWLDKYKDDAGTIYVSNLWLQKGNEMELVEDYIQNSFFDHAEQPNSNYVIKGWITRGGNPELIRKSFERYINNASEDQSIIATVIIWLKGGGPSDSIRYYFTHKFYDHCSFKESFYIIEHYILHNIDFATIKPYIVRYIEFNWKEINAVRLIESCTKQKYDLAQLKASIFKIIGNLTYNPFINFLNINNNEVIVKTNNEITNADTEASRALKTLFSKIQNTLKTLKSPESIKDEIIENLMKYGQKKEAGIILTAWIEYGNDFEMIRPFLTDWLDRNFHETFYSLYLVAQALENEKSFIIVHDAAIELLKKVGNTYDAKYLLSSWLKLKGNDDAKEIDEWIIYWVANLYDPKKHNWRDDMLLHYASVSDKSEN